MSHLFDRNGRRYHGGALPSHDVRELRYAYPRILAHEVTALPARFTLARYLTPVEDQGMEGSCTGHAASSAAEALARISNQPPVALSRRDGYYWARKLANLPISQDTGAPLNTASDAALGGLCREQTWPYRAGEFAQEPPPAEAGERPQFQFLAAHQSLFPNNSDRVLAMKVALVNKQPIIVGFTVYGDFTRTPQNESVMPATTGGGALGGHAVWVWGFQDGIDPRWGQGYFLARNSWGRQWGPKPPDPEAEAGDFLIPYAAVQNGIIFEARAFVPKAAPPPPPPPPPPPAGDLVHKADVIRLIQGMPPVA
jgi:C1A family cysteine protease